MSSSTNSSTGCDSNCVSSELPTGSNQYISISNDIQEFCGAWQFNAWQDGWGASRGPETHLIPSTQPVAGDNWRLGAIPPRAASPHWLFPSAFTASGMHGGTADDTEANSTEDWTISTASTVPGISCSAAPDQFAQDFSALLSPAGADCSDPLVCTAQELVAAAVAALPPGVHAPVADSAALLNSGAVLLFGHASTTMCGTNTAQDTEHTACSLLSADGCDSHVLSTTGGGLQDPSAPVAAIMPPQQEQQAAAAVEPRTAAAAATEGLGPGGRAVRARLRSRRRQGLLVDSHAGMQQLVAAAAVSLPSTSPQELQNSTTCVLEHTQHGTAVLQHAPHVLGGLPGLSAKSGALSYADSHGMLASGDVLVLGVSAPNSGAVHAATIAACAEPAAGAEAAASPEPGQAAREPHMMPAGVGPQAQPVLQLLSCSSLASINPAGCSNSSLGLANLSNCSFMRLGSFSTAHGSFSGSDAGSFTSQRQGSFTGMTGGAAGACTGWPPGSGPAIGGSHAGAPPAGRPSPRPAPLPMLHESCSWGNKLNEADGQAGREQQLPQEQTQGQHGVSSSGQRQLPKPHEPDQQLIYLLD